MKRAALVIAAHLAAFGAVALYSQHARSQSAPAATNFTGNPLAQKGQHMIAGGNAPTLSSGCGTGAAIGGSDVAANIQMGTGTSQPCTITFAESYGNKPVCVVTSESATVSYSAAENGSSIAITSLVDLARYRYHCIGRPN